MSKGEKFARQHSNMQNALTTALSALRLRAGDLDDRKMKEKNFSGIIDMFSEYITKPLTHKLVFPLSIIADTLLFEKYNKQILLWCVTKSDEVFLLWNHIYETHP